MIEAVLSILTGGATGLLGSVVTGITDYFKTKQVFAHEEKMAEINIQILDKELEASKEITRMESEAKIEVGDAGALTASYSADRATYAGGKARESKWFVLVDVLRGLVRPLLTLYLAAVVTLLYIDFYTLMQGAEALPVKDIVQMSQTIVNTVLYVATTVLLWWFGTRNKIHKKLFG